ncbi:hypothetical protein SDC9_42610 [bioreactor metagenome]|uniref:Uncharacterized protein n=1 Tax=bioreactor metagenome TaxID=1076179 RepID=A0A644VZ58_9ZZZZ
MFPDFEQLPQFVLLFLTVTLPGLKPNLAASISTLPGRYFFASFRITLIISSSDEFLNPSYGISPVISLRAFPGPSLIASSSLFLLCFRRVADIHSAFSSIKAIARE